MNTTTSLLTALVLVIPASQVVSDESNQLLKDALSAAPVSLRDQVTVMDWNNNVLQEGSNNYVCFPTPPTLQGTAPMCLDGPWQKWAAAWMNKALLCLHVGRPLQTGNRPPNPSNILKLLPFVHKAEPPQVIVHVGRSDTVEALKPTLPALGKIVQGLDVVNTLNNPAGILRNQSLMLKMVKRLHHFYIGKVDICAQDGVLADHWGQGCDNFLLSVVL